MTAQSTAGDSMNSNVIGCTTETSLREAIELLQKHRIHALVVTDAPGALAGVFSQTDALRAWSQGIAYDRAMDQPVSEFMTRDVITCMPHTDLVKAAQILTKHKIHRLVVVEERNDGRVWPVGVLSQTDLVRKLSEEYHQ